MKVLLVSNYLNDAQESMQRFAGLMEKGLTHAGHEVRILRPQSIAGRLHPSGGVGKWLGYVDKFGVFPSNLKSALAWANVVHICDHSNSFYTKYLQTKPHIVSCHDLMAVRSALGEIPRQLTRWSGQRLQQLIVKGLVQAQHVVCVSEATRRDLFRITKLPEQRVSRIYNSLNYPYSRMGRDEAITRIRKLQIDLGETFFLHVGGNHWYKNRAGVLRIFSSIRKLIPQRNPKMVMVGKPWTDEMRRFVSENGLNDVTFELPGIGDEDLRALYSTAVMLLFPSLEEGFGWPIIEAQACGCPVLTSGRPPMDEVGGAAAIYVDPEDAEVAAASAVLALDREADLRQASVRNAARFTIAAMTEGYLSVYEKVCSQNSSDFWPN
jgi:glycosyltransferase involved in cell wall biosynthesis